MYILLPQKQNIKLKLNFKIKFSFSHNIHDKKKYMKKKIFFSLKKRKI